MSKGAGGGGHGGGGAGATTGQLTAAVNKLGVENADYLREGMRDMTAVRSAYAGATKAQAEAIATGKSPPMNDGKYGKKGQPLPAIHINIWPTAKNGRPGQQIVLNDGRHRMTAAREAGATHIRAEIREYGPRGGTRRTWIANVAIKGTK